MNRIKRNYTLIVLTVLWVLITSLHASAVYENEKNELLYLINNYRQSQGLSTLKLSATLSEAAEGHSLDMAKNNYFAHNSIDGRTPWTRIKAAGYTYCTTLGENIAAGYQLPASVLLGWQNSAEHNAIMLKPDFAVVGIGIAYNANAYYRWYWTTDFGGYDDTVGLRIDTVSPSFMYQDTKTEVTIAGIGFTPNTKVFIGSLQFNDPQFLGTDKLQIVMPAGTAKGKWQVRVDSTDCASYTVLDAFEVRDALSRYDFDSNHVVNIFDLIVVGKAFGMTAGSQGWDARADVVIDKIVNIFDLVATARNFGAKY
jgi:hypothetical protein